MRFRFPTPSPSIGRSFAGSTSSSIVLKWGSDKYRRLYSVPPAGVDGPDGSKDGPPGRSNRRRGGIRARGRDLRAEWACVRGDAGCPQPRPGKPRRAGAGVQPARGAQSRGHRVRRRGRYSRHDGDRDDPRDPWTDAPDQRRIGGDDPHLERIGRVHRGHSRHVTPRGHHPRQGDPGQAVGPAHDGGPESWGREGPLFDLPRASRAPGPGTLLPAGRAHGTTEARGRLCRLEALRARDRTRRWEGRGETSGASERGSRSRWTRSRSGRLARSVPRPKPGSRSRRTGALRPPWEGSRTPTTTGKTLAKPLTV